MFEHSIPVPKKYKLASKILQKVKEEGQNLKSLLYDEKNRFFPVQAIHALTVEALKHESKINELLLKSKLLFVENKFDPWLARILITELIWGKHVLPGESKPEKTIVQYQKAFESILESLDSSETVGNDPAKVSESIQPKYIRINTLKIATADAVRHFQDEGWNLVRCSSKSYDDYLKQVENLANDEFLPDFHVKVVFTFPSTAKFHCDLLYNNYDILIQNKATCLASFILDPKPGSTVLDMCAAPGMKTTHLAAIMKNEGTVYAVEQNLERYQSLCEFIESSGSTCVQAIHGDAAQINKIKCPNVDYVLLDPSCSGSGIKRVKGNDSVFDLQSGRVAKLAAFQAKLLRHALNEFRTAKRVVYSTCSLYREENEEVIQDVIKNHKGNFKLVSAKEKLNNNWNNVGDPKYAEIGEKCLYARPSTDYTCGFFIAVFEKTETDNLDYEMKTILKKINEAQNQTNLNVSNEKAMINSEVKINNSKKKKQTLEFETTDFKPIVAAGCSNETKEVVVDKKLDTVEVEKEIETETKILSKKKTASKNKNIEIDDEVNKIKKTKMSCEKKTDKDLKETTLDIEAELEEKKDRRKNKLFDKSIENSISNDVIEGKIKTFRKRKNGLKNVEAMLSEIESKRINNEEKNETNEENYDVDEVVNECEIKVKKNKKRITVTVHSLKESKDTSNTEKKMKKNKKAKRDPIEKNATEERNIEECKVKPRKRKRSKSENDDNDVNVHEIEEPSCTKKSKKKKKKSVIEHEIITDKQIETVDGNVVSSKKKKKSKHALLGENTEEHNVVECEVKPKKRKISKSHCDDDNIDANETLKPSNTKKSKKKNLVVEGQMITDTADKRIEIEEIVNDEHYVKSVESVLNSIKSTKNLTFAADKDLTSIIADVEPLKKKLKKKRQSTLTDNDVSAIGLAVKKKIKKHKRKK